MIKPNTVEQFIDEWNKMPDSVDVVYIFSHGNGMSLIFQNEKGISANGLNKDGKPIAAISDLKSKTIGDLYLMSCNSGHEDLYRYSGTNAASAFSRLGNNERVHAFDGSMSFGPWFFPNKQDYHARFAGDQSGYLKVYKVFHVPFTFKLPKGWIIY